jgi:hypothetical protein
MKGLLKLGISFGLVTSFLTSSGFAILPPDEGRLIVIRSLYAVIPALDDSHEEYRDDPITRKKRDEEAAIIENESGLHTRQLCEETDMQDEQEEDSSPSAPNDFSQE